MFISGRPTWWMCDQHISEVKKDCKIQAKESSIICKIKNLIYKQQTMIESFSCNHLCLPKYVCIHLLPIVGLDNFLQIVVWNQFCCKYLFTVIFCCKFSFSIIFLQVCKFDHLFLQAASVSFIHNHFSHLVPFLGNCITNSFSFCKLFFWISFCST